MISKAPRVIRIGASLGQQGKGYVVGVLEPWFEAGVEG
jgi:hypothetical protein